jgi:hypothetical protein
MITGRILSADGSPVTGVRVGAFAVSTLPSNAPLSTSDAAIMSLSQTDAQGRYRLENVPQGRYYIVADWTNSPIYFPGVALASDARVITIAGNAALENQDFRLSQPMWLKVRGRVIREGHRAGSQVILSGNGPALTANIAADGSFEFPVVRPGVYQARVAPRLNALPAIPVTVRDKDISDLELTIPLSAVTDVRVTLKVALEGEGLLPRFQLQYESLGQSGIPGVRGMLINGPTTQLAVPLGEFRLRPASPGTLALPAGYFFKSITSGSVDLLSTPLQITAADAPEILITLGVSSRPWVKVSGRMTKLEGATATGVSIRLEGPSIPSGSPLAVWVDPDGSFEFPMVLPGTYQARITPATDPFGRTIVVGATDLTNIEIPFKLPPLKVEGRTDSPQLRQQGQLRPTQILRAVLAPELVGPGQAPLVTVVENNGTFAFASVPPGLYGLSISICEFDVCTSSGGIPIVVDKDLTGIDIPVRRTQPAERPVR